MANETAKKAGKKTGTTMDRSETGVSILTSCVVDYWIHFESFSTKIPLPPKSTYWHPVLATRAYVSLLNLLTSSDAFPSSLLT